MASSLWQDILNIYKRSSVVIQIIAINAVVFISIHLIGALFKFNEILDPYFTLRPDFKYTLLHPWTILTHMFNHASPGHIFFNMLMLFFMGSMFLRMHGKTRFLGTYFMGGLSGALFLFLMHLTPLFADVPVGTAVGASAAIMAIAVGTATTAPEQEIRLFGIVPVKLKFLGMFMVAMDLLQFWDSNTGGHMAHLGGAVFGFVAAWGWKNGKNYIKPYEIVAAFVGGLFKRSEKSKMKVKYKKPENQRKAQGMNDDEYNMSKAQEQARIDKILDKISASGYDSLSKEEKDFLFKAGKR